MKFVPKEWLQVKRSRTGLGIFTKEPIAKGVRVLEYTGEKITNQEADRRGGRYLFEVNSRYTIDGKGRENLARYANHSCDPNCEAIEDRGRVYIDTRRKVRANEELTYDYGQAYTVEIIGPEGCRCQVCIP